MSSKTMYKVQVGAFQQKANAEKAAAKLKQKKIPAVIVTVGDIMKVQCGAFTVKGNAEKRLAEIKKAGFLSAVIVTVPGTEPAPAPIKATSGPDKVYAQMRPFINSNTAHKDFIKGYNAFIDEYNKANKAKHSKVDSSDAWCTEFVELMFYRAGFLNQIGYGKRAADLVENAKKRKTWKSGSSDIQYGDVVIYQDRHGNPNHTEFALGPHDFVSGNYRGGVHKRHRSSLSTVKGRIRPVYPK